MKHVLSNWPEIQGFLEGHYLFLCLDYDGTLIRIVRNPGSANLSRTNCRTLQALSKAKEVKTALVRSEEHTSELQSQSNLVCRLLLEKNQKTTPLLHSPPLIPSSTTPQSTSSHR